MKWLLVEDAEELALTSAKRLLSSLQTHPSIVLGLPTGRTPEGMYRRIAEQCASEYHCFRQATTFNLDEYVGVPGSHPGSYCSYMHRHLFDHVDLDPARIHIPDGLASSFLRSHPELSVDEALAMECEQYEGNIARAGSLNLTFLGLGTNGHIGFNEPGTSFFSRTRMVELSEATRTANAEFFSGQAVPRRAITIGIATILESTSIVLLASGERKAEILRRFATEPGSESLPASALRHHPDVTIIADRAAAALIDFNRL